MSKLLFTAVFCVTATIVQSTASAKQIRVATFNVSLFGEKSGDIVDRLEDSEDDQAESIARIVQTVRPDVLLVNEIDHDVAGRSIRLLRKMIADGPTGLRYEFVYAPPSNTGLATGRDLDGDGRTDGPADAHGFGRFPGQYAMAVLSRYPIDLNGIRTFQKFRWADLPGASPPIGEDGEPYYDPDAWTQLRLSSKNHIDVPIQIDGHVIHLLGSHPTPPVFDGPEDRNGLRNRDEIRFWSLYLNNDPAIIDDDGQTGGLPNDASFVIAGDLNSDSQRGDSIREAIAKLKDHARVHPFVPRHDGDETTALFGNREIRVDYVLASRQSAISGGGVYWPRQGQPAADVRASDHRLVWIDINLDADLDGDTTSEQR